MSKIIIKLIQRENNNLITVIEGLHPTYDITNLVKCMKEKFECNGGVFINTVTNNQMIKLGGDKRNKVKQFLIEEGLVPADAIIIDDIDIKIYQ